MDKKRTLIIQYITILALGISIAVLLGYIMIRATMNIDASFAPDLTVVDNPLMGFAPDAANPALCEKANMVYLEVSFRDWEPKEDVFDIKGLEQKYDIARWKKEHKYAVLRFVCDIPGQEDHIDIPDWLYEKCPNGVHYETGLGKGFSPDYTNRVFMEYHKKAVQKLAEYCNKDHFVAFVEMGSLGHWGEWHCTDGGGKSLMPDEKICTEYANLYSESFTGSVVLARRNYEAVVEGQMGFYNDMTGAPEDTKDWLTALRKGGSQETSGKSLTLKPLEYFGRNEPIGGEFTSSIPMERLMGEDLGQTLELISDSNLTVIGPKVPDLTDENYQKAANSVLRRMGYRLYVSDLHTRYDFAKNSMVVQLTFKNAGPAGFYFDWPVTVYVFDKDKNQVYWEGLDVDLHQLGTEDSLVGTIRVPVGDTIRDEFYIGVSVTDYEGQERITLAIDDGKKPEFIDKAQVIYHFMKE